MPLNISESPRLTLPPLNCMNLCLHLGLTPSHPPPPRVHSHPVEKHSTHCPLCVFSLRSVLYDISVLASPLTWILLLTLIVSIVTQVSCNDVYMFIFLVKSQKHCGG